MDIGVGKWTDGLKKEKQNNFNFGILMLCNFLYLIILLFLYSIQDLAGMYSMAVKLLRALQQA